MRLVRWLVDSGVIYLFWGFVKLIQFCCSYRTSYADSAAKYKVVEQVMGKLI